MSHSVHLPVHHERPRWHWWVLLAVTVAALIFGVTGFRQYGHITPPAQGGTVARDEVDFLTALYHTLQLFILHTPHFDKPPNLPLELARWLAAGVSLTTILGALWRVYAMELRHFSLGLTCDHVVICGLGRRGLDLVRCHRQKPRREKVVVIEQDAPLELIEACRSCGAAVIIGDVTDPALLREARVHKAKRLIAVCGKDSTNVEVAVRTHRLVNRIGGDSRMLECYIQISDLDLRVSFQRNKLLADSTRLPDGRPRCHVLFFDIYESNARRLLLDTLPLDHAGVRKHDPRQVHLVVLGLGRMGRSVALKAAQLGHFANGQRLKISVLDRDATRHEQELLFRYPSFRQVCEIEFHSLEVASIPARTLLDAWCDDSGKAASIAVCFDNDALALDVALRLLPKVRERGVPIAIRMASQSGLATLLGDGASPKEVSFYIRTFGTLDDACCERAYEDPEQDQMAKLIQLRFIDKGKSHDRRPEIDKAMRDWENLPEDYKDSNRQQADHLPIKVRAMGCEVVPENDKRPEAVISDDETELLAELEHVRWIGERTLAGWTHAKGTKNEDLRTNPNLVPWSDLDEKTKDYDRDTIRNIPHLLRTLKKKICRKEPIV